jgi:hypothetical protein
MLLQEDGKMKKKNCSYLILTMAVLFCVQSIVFAYDINPPVWRGSSNSTFQIWEFANDHSPADLSTGWINPNGTPTATIQDPFEMVDWLVDYNAGGSEIEYGIWKLYAGKLLLEIPNTDNTAPDSSKEIWMQITYYDPTGVGGNLPVVAVPSYTTLTLVNRTELPSNFLHDTYKIIIEPNPSIETIKISPIQCQLYVDEIIVDTICVPEPATIAIFALGSLMFVRRRRS